ncbi:MAG TPA: imidazolonepropionase, partial [Chloroflexi bacterium]|nr:imidazolonepropionase [Chloroflexota bacterium]
MTRPRADLIVRNASELLTCAGERDPGIVREGALAVAGDEILVVGTWDDVAAAVDL